MSRRPSEKVLPSACFETVQVLLKSQEGPVNQPRASSYPDLGDYKESVGSCSPVLRVSFSCVPQVVLVLRFFMFPSAVSPGCSCSPVLHVSFSCVPQVVLGAGSVGGLALTHRL